MQTKEEMGKILTRIDGGVQIVQSHPKLKIFHSNPRTLGSSNLLGTEESPLKLILSLPQSRGLC
jgi:hypothetical protein